MSTGLTALLDTGVTARYLPGASVGLTS